MDQFILTLGKWFIDQGPTGVCILILLIYIAVLNKRNNALVDRLVSVIETNSSAMSRLSTLIEGRLK